MKTIYKPIRFPGLLALLLFCLFPCFAQQIPEARLIETVNNNLRLSIQQYKQLGNALQTREWPRTFKDGKLLKVNSRAWISGFYPGTLLYLYEFSGDDWLWNESEERLEIMEELKTMTTHHDLGFMMYSSFGNAFRLTRNPHYRQVLVQSAKSLASRFNPVVGCIQSWDQVKSLDGRRTLKFPVIIDNMMNLELLFFASKVTGDPQYRNIAIEHAETTLKNHFRPDFSSYHVVDYDTISGAVKSQETVQGFSDNSTWARGQAWAIYGFSMTYRETQNKRFLEAAEKMADYYLGHPNLPADMIPYWDFNVNQEGYDPAWDYDPGLYPVVPRDASAAAIVASALIELAGFTDAGKRERYLAAAEKTIISLSSPKYRNALGENGGFILKHASGGVPGNIEVDVPLSYADYYYVESLMRYKQYRESAAPVPADTILNRYQGYLFRTEGAGAKPSKAIKLANKLNADGKWPDINYSDAGLSNWKTLDHLKRLKTLALAWANPGSELHHQQGLKEKIDLALRHWLTERYKNANWWYNEIGVPQYMRDILVPLRNDLDSGAFRGALEVLGQLYMREDFVAGNLIWSADLGLHYGALTGDQQLMRRCSDLISAEIKSGAGEGIQSDFSFHQHGARLQMYQYGKAYLQESLRIAWQLRDTGLAFPRKKIELLTRFLTEGWQWMARGVNTVPGTMDRSASRKGELRSADIRELIPFLIELQPGKEARFRELLSVQNAETSLQGYRYYPRSDFAAYHRKDFSFFLKTISTRTLATESINNENLKGKLLGSGDTYLIGNGREYFDLLPLWDWTALPGLTTFKNAYKIERKPFTGGVSDDTSGLSVMDYLISDSASVEQLAAKKFWACHKDMVVCLIGGLQVENIRGKIYTALDQCRWQGNVTASPKGRPLNEGVTVLDEPNWIHHSSFAYLPLQAGPVEIHLEEKKGRWTSINASETTLVLTDSVFKPVMYHNPEKAGWAYVIAFSEGPEAAERLAENPGWEVLSNNENCQAVRFDGGTTMIACYGPASLTLSDGKRISADKPCLLLVKENSVYLSDPSQSGTSVRLRIGDKSLKVDLPPDGTTKRVLLSEHR